MQCEGGGGASSLCLQSRGWSGGSLGVREMSGMGSGWSEVKFLWWYVRIWPVQTDSAQKKTKSESETAMWGKLDSKPDRNQIEIGSKSDRNRIGIGSKIGSRSDRNRIEIGSKSDRDRLADRNRIVIGSQTGIGSKNPVKRSQTNFCFTPAQPNPDKT